MSEKGEQGKPLLLPSEDDESYYPASEPGQKEKCLNAKYIKYGLSVFIIVIIVVVLGAFTQQINEMRHEIKTLKREYQSDKWKRNGAAKEHDIEKNKNNSLRPSTEELGRIRERVQKLQPNKTTNTTTTAFQDTKEHLNFLISSLGRNLSADGSHVSRLRFELNAKNELTKAESNIDELWKRWNHTNAVVEDLTKLLTKQNETLHFKIAYHSDTLYSEVKDAELKQTKFHDETNKVLNELRNQLKTTRQNLEQRLDDKISRAHRPLEDSVKSARSSIEEINVKADGMKKSIANMKQQQSEIKNDLSKTKTEFQEKHRKHDSEISAQVSKTGGLKDGIAKLESERQSDTHTITSLKKKLQDLENKLKKIENGASGLLRTDIKQYIFVPFLGWLIYYVLFN